MTNEPMDKRVTKTRRSLVYAMLSLLEKRSFQRITVNDICEEALVGRSTFYAHFEDKFALLRACLEELGARLRARGECADPIARLGQAFAAIRENSAIFKHIFDASANQELRDLFQTHFVSLFTSIFEKHAAIDPAMPSELYAVYSATGLTGTILWWIGRGYPIDETILAEFHFARLHELMAGENPMPTNE